MERWRGKVAVVTGASAGIGLATVKALLREGLLVVGLARRREKMLREIDDDWPGASNFTALRCDVTREDEVARAFEYVEKNLKSVNVLVNNAGTVKASTVEVSLLAHGSESKKSKTKKRDEKARQRIADATTRELQDVVNLNFMNYLYCYKRAVRLMKANGEEGYVVNISSIGGHKFPSPGDEPLTSYNVYIPTKFAVSALSEVLIRELLGSNIRVTNLSPGLVKTEVTTINDQQLNLPAVDADGLQPEDVADTILYLLGTPRHVQITQISVEPLGWDY